MTFSEEIEEALDAFWYAAYEQGRDHRNHDDEDGTAQKAEEELRKAITAALAVQPEAVRVKALEWREGPPSTYTEVAESPFGHYSVWEINGTGCWAPWKQGFGTIAEGGIAGAKAAAQADYEARVLSAIATTQENGHD